MGSFNAGDVAQVLYRQGITNNIMGKSKRKEYIKKRFNELAGEKKFWKKKKDYYNKEVIRFYKFLIPKKSSVLELGSGSGNLLAALNPDKGVGIDLSGELVKEASEKYPHIEFMQDDAENIKKVEGEFDYIISSDLVGHLDDIYSILKSIEKYTNNKTRIIFSFYSRFWEPVIKIAEALHLKIPQNLQNWISLNNMQNLLEISGYKVINRGMSVLFPVYIPAISEIFNRIIAKIPLIKKLCLAHYIVARKPYAENKYKTSVIVPSLNEKGNIEDLVKRTPKFGGGIEIIFVDGVSDDGTVEEIERVIREYPNKDIKLIHQGGRFGKNDAVIKGFKAASGDILMIHDSDITVDPETLPAFYDVISSGKGEFINGSRLVYTMEKQAMRFLNMLGNKFFSVVFSYLLNQRIKDTLCGTKVLFKKDWQKIYNNREYFGDFDPFGDFELLFGAAK